MFSHEASTTEMLTGYKDTQGKLAVEQRQVGFLEDLLSTKLTRIYIAFGRDA